MARLEGIRLISCIKTLPIAEKVNFPKYPGLKLSEIIPKECRITEAGLDLIK